MKLYVLFLGEACIDKGAVISPGVGDGLRVHIPIPAYLLEMDDGQHVLIDTGMHKKHIQDPEATFRGMEIAKVLLPVMRPEDSMVRRLAELDLSPQDIDYVINTHLHFDHCGNNYLFKDSTIYANKNHYEIAKEHPNFPSENFDLPHLTYKLLEGEPEIFPGVQAVLTPGHAPYHWSFLISLKHDGNVLLCSDAIYCQDNIDHDSWGGQMEPEVAKESAQKLMTLADEKDAMMVYGHDPDQWRTLRKAPLAYYS
jgi:N-acyl homoserine lactone hydrolase